MADRERGELLLVPTTSSALAASDAARAVSCAAPVRGGAGDAGIMSTPLRLITDIHDSRCPLRGLSTLGSRVLVSGDGGANENFGASFLPPLLAKECTLYFGPGLSSVISSCWWFLSVTFTKQSSSERESHEDATSNHVNVGPNPRTSLRKKAAGLRKRHFRCLCLDGVDADMVLSRRPVALYNRRNDVNRAADYEKESNRSCAVLLYLWVRWACGQSTTLRMGQVGALNA